MLIKYDIIRKEASKYLTLKEVKNYLRVTHDYDDNLINELIKAAIEYAENFTGKIIGKWFVKCKIEETLPKIYLKYQPIQKLEVVEVKINDQLVNVTSVFGKLCLEKSLIFVYKTYQRQSIWLQYSCGFAPLLPLMIKNNMLKHITIMYEIGSEQGLIEEINNVYISYRQLKI